MKIITVVGCAGGRYKEKRSLIGKIVLKYSKLDIFTSDDPRDEDPRDIIKTMINGNKKGHYISIINRKDAVIYALNLASEKDLVLILGKGRDNYMAIGKEKIYYSDIDTIDEYIMNNK